MIQLEESRKRIVRQWRMMRTLIEGEEGKDGRIQRSRATTTTGQFALRQLAISISSTEGSTSQTERNETEGAQTRRVAFVYECITKGAARC